MGGYIEKLKEKFPTILSEKVNYNIFERTKLGFGCPRSSMLEHRPRKSADAGTVRTEGIDSFTRILNRGKCDSAFFSMPHTPGDFPSIKSRRRPLKYR